MWLGTETLPQRVLSTFIIAFLMLTIIGLLLSFFKSENFVTNSKLYLDPNDQQIFNFDGLEGFGEKDISGGVQRIYALRLNKTTITFENDRISTIFLGDESISFKYNKTHYQAILNDEKSSKMLFESENFDFSFPKIPFSEDQEIDENDLFKGGIINLMDTYSKSKITNALVTATYKTIQGKDRSIILPPVGQGAYYFSFPSQGRATRSRLLQEEKKVEGVSKENYKSSLIKNLQALTKLMRKYPVSNLIDKVVSKVSIEAIERYVMPALEKGQACVDSIEFFDNAKDYLALPTNLKVMFTLEQVLFYFVDVYLSSNSFFKKDLPVPTKSGFCDDTTVAGTDLPDRRTINIGGSNKELRFSYETYTVKDRIDIYYQNSLIYSTGCVGARGTVKLPINGNETNVVVKVTPNCEGTTGTQWNYVLQCQESLLICKDNACSCYPSGAPNQIKEPEYDGCGSSETQSATVYGWIFDIGGVWGFTKMCNQHDICYGTCGANRLNCDSTFCQDLKNSCQSQPKTNYARCLKYADIYCKAVTLLGEKAFNEGQTNHCKCPNNSFL